MDEVDSPPLYNSKDQQYSLALDTSSYLSTRTYTMSDSGVPAAAGSKRSRDDVDEASPAIPSGNGEGIGNGHGNDVPEMPSADLEDSDDEIGPMPDAPVEVSKGRKKKRAVLSHERVYLDNIPDTDRYTKSFMHRADLNFVTMTK